MLLNLSITKKQRSFIESGEQEVLFGGAAGGGRFANGAAKAERPAESLFRRQTAGYAARGGRSRRTAGCHRHLPRLFAEFHHIRGINTPPRPRKLGDAAIFYKISLEFCDLFL